MRFLLLLSQPVFSIMQWEYGRKGDGELKQIAERRAGGGAFSGICTSKEEAPATFSRWGLKLFLTQHELRQPESEWVPLTLDTHLQTGWFNEAGVFENIPYQSTRKKWGAERSKTLQKKTNHFFWDQVLFLMCLHRFHGSVHCPSEGFILALSQT